MELIEKEPCVPRRPAVVSSERFRGNIVFDNVHFAYPDRPEAKVLNGLSLTIEHGKTLALVGHSGSGKSTVVSLLMRFFQPQSGTITVDGKPLQEIEHHWWMSRVGYVGQDVTLFSGSILQNVQVSSCRGSLVLTFSLVLFPVCSL